MVLLHAGKSGSGSVKERAVSDNNPPATDAKRRRTPLVVVGIAVSVIVIALALGLGLGLGLRKHHDTSSSTSTSSAPSSSAAPVPAGTPLPGNGGSSATSGLLEEWRLDPKSYILDTSWDLNATPTTRHYDLVISEGLGWPDG